MRGSSSWQPRRPACQRASRFSNVDLKRANDVGDKGNAKRSRLYFGNDVASQRPRLYSIATAFLMLVVNALFVSGIQTIGAAIALQSR